MRAGWLPKRGPQHGTNAPFTVTATGTAPLVYQWAFGGTNLAGATADTLLLTNVEPAQAGSYSVVITNVAGSVTSSVASLIVLPTGAIISISLSVGAEVSITFPSVAGAGYVLEYTVIHQVASRQPVRFLDQHDAQPSTNSGLVGAPAQFAQSKVCRCGRCHRRRGLCSGE